MSVAIMDTDYAKAQRIISPVTHIGEQVALAIAAERERCALVAEHYKSGDPETVRNINYRLAIAAKIREGA